MPRYVVPDSDTLGASFFKETYTQAARPLHAAIRDGSVDALAPSIGLVEFLHICQKKKRDRKSDPVTPVLPEVVDGIVAEFLDLPIVWIDLGWDAAKQAWLLHREHQIEVFDAYFLILGQAWEADIWTLDSVFAANAGRIYKRIFDIKKTPFRLGNPA